MTGDWGWNGDSQLRVASGYNGLISIPSETSNFNFFSMTQSQIMCHVRGQNQRKIKVSNWAVWHSHRIHICMGSTYVEYFYKWSDFDHIIWNCFVLQYTYQIKIYKTCFHTLSLVWKTNWYWYWCFHLHLDQYKKVHMLVIIKYPSTEGRNISFYLP